MTYQIMLKKIVALKYGKGIERDDYNKEHNFMLFSQKWLKEKSWKRQQWKVCKKSMGVS